MDTSLNQIRVEIKPSQAINVGIILFICLVAAGWLGVQIQEWLGFPFKGVFPVLGVIGVFIAWIKSSTGAVISKHQERADKAEEEAINAKTAQEDAELLLESWHAEIQEIKSLKERNQALTGEAQSMETKIQSLKATRQSLEKELASANKKLASAEKNLATANDEIRECITKLKQSAIASDKKAEQSLNIYKQSIAPYLELHKHSQAYFGLWSVTNNRNASQEARSLASADKEQARAHIDTILKKASPVGFKFDPDDYQVELTSIY